MVKLPYLAPPPVFLEDQLQWLHDRDEFETFFSLASEIGLAISGRSSCRDHSHENDNSHLTCGTYIARLLRRIGTNSNLSLRVTKNELNDDADRSQPDLLCYVYSIAIFRGEERTTEEELPAAVHALTDKMGVWNPNQYGELPFMLGYATGGSFIQ